GEGPDLARLRPFLPSIRKLANLEELELLEPGAARVTDALFATFAGFEVYLRITNPELLQREIQRLEKDLAKASASRDRFAAKLANPGFLAKAAPEILPTDRAALGAAAEAASRR